MYTLPVGIHSESCLFMPQSHFSWRLPDESKLGNVAGGQPFVAFVKNHLGISVVVMQQVKMQGRWLGIPQIS